jgi:phosphatidylcholine synthase
VITPLLPLGWHAVCAVVIVLAGSYQFCQVDAKTEDHFFKGFPSYWNIVIFYLFFWDMNVWVNFSVIVVLALMSFIPIKYVYPSRLDYLTSNSLLRRSMGVFTVIWGVSTIGLLWVYPAVNVVFVALSMGYIVFYFIISGYRTWKPLPYH